MSAGRKFFMATEAWAGKDGETNISRDTPDLCLVGRETISHYIGNWVAGFGFINVKFPKETTRELTPEERQYYRDHDKLRMPGGNTIRICIDEEEPLECI